MIPVMLGVVLIIFFMLSLSPGDPAVQILGPEATPEQYAELTEQLGLNDPFLVRYFNYVVGICKGDLGTSYSTKQPVINEIIARFPTTILLSALSCVVGAVIGIIFGIISAVKQYSFIDNLTRVFALIGMSVPSFWLGLMFIILFSVKLHWLPSSGFYGPKYWILPSVTIGLVQASNVARQTRSAMLDVVRQDYIRTARAKGQTEMKIIFEHELPNALIPIVTVLGMQFGRGLGGSIISEQVFAIPGIGMLMTNAIGNLDYPVVQGGVLIIALTFSIVNLVIDILYAFIDPRIKSLYAGKKKKVEKAADVKNTEAKAEEEGKNDGK